MRWQRLPRVPTGYRVNAVEVLRRYTPDHSQATTASYHISDHNFNLDISLSYGLVVGTLPQIR